MVSLRSWTFFPSVSLSVVQCQEWFSGSVLPAVADSRGLTMPCLLNRLISALVDVRSIALFSKSLIVLKGEQGIENRTPREIVAVAVQ